ncbi:MAG TPA: ATP-binding protein, partial [Mycobacterium sp.]|nr:ATP-binding protein [Mycobacterium sp.]
RSRVREAVSNAPRHANATTLAITVTVEDQLFIDVVDNGDGIPDDITGGGLNNLRQRAQRKSAAPSRSTSRQPEVCRCDDQHRWRNHDRRHEHRRPGRGQPPSN